MQVQMEVANVLKLPTQRKYKVMMPHENTVKGAFRFWLKGGNGECKYFCPKCQLYFRCQEYVVEKKFSKESKVNVRNGH